MAQLRNAINIGGVAEALHYLNSRTAHRFTAVYKFLGDMQRLVFIHDKLKQPDPRFNAIRTVDSFCQFIDPSEPFGIADAVIDGRAGGYRHFGLVASYYGLGLSQAGQRPSGSLCHFDLVPRPLPAPEECAFLNRARYLLLERLNGFHR